MKLKQFLKPDWRKIFLTIIIIILWIFFWHRVYSAPLAPPLELICCDLIEELTSICQEQPNNPCCKFTLKVCEKLEIEREKRNLISTVTFVGSLILSYPISCLIIWIYDKRKKK